MLHLLVQRKARRIATLWTEWKPLPTANPNHLQAVGMFNAIKPGNRRHMPG